MLIALPITQRDGGAHVNPRLPTVKPHHTRLQRRGACLRVGGCGRSDELGCACAWVAGKGGEGERLDQCRVAGWVDDWMSIGWLLHGWPSEWGGVGVGSTGYGVLQVCCVLLHSTACTSVLRVLSDWTLGAAAYPYKKIAIPVRRHTKVFADGEG